MCIDENKEYEFSSDIEELQNFYIQQGYDVTVIDNCLIVKDTTGIKSAIDGNYSFENVFKQLKITVNGSKISFEIIEV